MFHNEEMAQMDALLYIGTLSFGSGWEYGAVIYKVPARYACISVKKSYIVNGEKYTLVHNTYELVQPAYYTYMVVTNKNPIQVKIPEAPPETQIQAILHTSVYPWVFL